MPDVALQSFPIGVSGVIVVLILFRILNMSDPRTRSEIEDIYMGCPGRSSDDLSRSELT